MNPITFPRAGPLKMAIAPYPTRLGTLNVWQFTIGGLDFFLKTDRRPFPESFEPYLANGNDPIVLGRIEARGLHEVPLFQPMLKRMMTRTGDRHEAAEPASS